LLGNLSFISSILVGFGLEALITLVTSKKEEPSDRAKDATELVREGTDRAKDAITEQMLTEWTFAVWMLASVLLLVLLVLAEVIRRRAVGATNIQASPESAERTRRRCGRLVLIFTVALLLTTSGVVLLGFLFSPTHGILGLSAVAFGVVLIFWALR
jgi:hypothetical protein